MAKIDITRTELVWPGKYNEDGTRKEVPRVNLPFQVIETVNESRVDREPNKGYQASLFDVWEGKEGSTFEDGWKNKLIWGDNLLVMGSLLEKFAGKIDLIYIDPPFATGADFTFNTQIGEGNLEATKEHSIIEEKAYRDTWGRNKDSWFNVIYPRLEVMRELLSSNGTIYIHLDWYIGHQMKAVLDDIFGETQSLGEIVWAYGSPSGGRVAGAKLVKAHDFIYIYSKQHGQHKYRTVYLPYSQKYINDWFRYTDEDGRRYQKRWRRDSEGRSYTEKQYLDESPGVPASTVWSDIQQAYADPRAYRAGMTSEITGYPTQKPSRLLERIIEISSDSGDLVADFFCGSGTTLSVAEKLGRRWIGCDLSRWAVHVTRKRLLDIENCKPFEILNLGKYERKYWQGVTFKDKDKADQQMAIYQYIAFILRLYSAEPLSGMEHLHGKKGSAVVHVGAVDAPVTIDEIRACIEECARLKLIELHIVGWEWEMGLAGPNNDYRRGGLMHDAAREEGIKLYLFQIPREVMEQQAVDKGDIQFFELAYLESKVIKPEKLTVQVALEDFVIPNSDLIPDEIRQRIKKWSDYIDYWAVDWNFQNDTFIQGWVSYRTRRDRSLKLTTERHTYEKAGKYRILLKVIDIFGNDTSQPIDVEVT